jgi:pimeloyl-ACP methyl ester carboxylesterase
MPTITTNDGVQLYYEDVGARRPLILIPGWTCTHHFFQKNITTLAQSCRVIAPDMRAHGDSAKVAWGHRIARYAKDVKDLMRPCVWNTSRCSGGP